MSRPKRKGRDGCYVCAAPTDCIVQVWMREYYEDPAQGRYKSGNRRQRTVKSISISLCREHGEEFYGRYVADVPVITEKQRDRSNDIRRLQDRIGAA